jgi:cell division inhibitor SepF
VSSGMWYRTLVYLGLKEEPEEGYDDLPERLGNGDEHLDDRVVHQRFDPVGDPDLDPERRPSRDDTTARSRAAEGHENVRALRVADAGNGRSRGGAVRVAVVEVTRFDDVEEIGSRYRTGQPVLFDVSGTDGGTARRVVDFVSGLTYALRGRMAKVGTKAFILVSDGVELPEDEIRRLTALGYRLPEARA